MRFRALLLAGAVLFGVGQARADVTYNFITTRATGIQNNYGGFPNDGTGYAGFPLSLSFTAAGVASGEVSGSVTANLFGPPSVIGLAGFTGLTTYMDAASLTALANSLQLDVKFGAGGAITAETLAFSGTDLTINLTNGVASLGSDGLLNCTAVVESNACTSTGSFVLQSASAVPEPTAAAIAATALLALAGWRRKRV